MRYVEANPLRAGLVKRAQGWPWSSANPWARTLGSGPPLADWPTARPAGWLAFVNGSVDEEELDRIRTSVIRGRPLADAKWQLSGPLSNELRHTFNPTHRPARHSKIGTVSVPVPESGRLWEEP
jgi:putative transposase